MKITKYGHCCLLVEEAGARILIDPGALTEGKHPVEGIDVVLITHEHFDHCHVPSVAAVLAGSPACKVYTIPAVGDLLAKEGALHSLIAHGQSVQEKGVLIEAVGEKHAVVHPDIPQVGNVGFFIAERFFYPGDALTRPGRSPEILALPVAAPWLKLSEAVDYARALKPKHCFAVHDGIIAPELRTRLGGDMIAKLLPGIVVRQPRDGEPMEF